MKLQVAFTVRAPIEKVFAAFLYGREAMSIFPEARIIEFINGSQEAMTVGTKLRFAFDIKGKVAEQTAEITLLEPNSRAVQKLSDKVTDYIVDLRFRSEGEVTYFEARYDYRFKSFLLYLLQPALVRPLIAALRQRMRRVIDHLEQSSAAAPKIAVQIAGLPYRAFLISLWITLVFGFFALFRWLDL